MPTKLSVVEAAEETGLSSAWWREQIFNRAIPFYKVGRRVLLDPADIEAFLDRCRVEPSDAPIGTGVGGGQ